MGIARLNDFFFVDVVPYTSYIIFSYIFRKGNWSTWHHSRNLVGKKMICIRLQNRLIFALFLSPKQEKRSTPHVCVTPMLFSKTVILPRKGFLCQCCYHAFAIIIYHRKFIAKKEELFLVYIIQCGNNQNYYFQLTRKILQIFFYFIVNTYCMTKTCLAMNINVTSCFEHV